MRGAGRPASAGAVHAAMRGGRVAAAVRVCLLIPTHALPPLSYRVPGRLRGDVRVGSVVVAPLSGHSRLGVVVGTDVIGEHAREDLRGVEAGASLPSGLVEACVQLSEEAVVPLAGVLGAALPPGVGGGRYRVLRPEAAWPWKEGTLVGRRAARRVLGAEGLLKAEGEGRISLSASPPARRAVEWARAHPASEPDFGKATRQRYLFALLRAREEGWPVRELLEAADADRRTLRELIRRGAATLEKRPEPVVLATGEGAQGPKAPTGAVRPTERTTGRGGAHLWRLPRAGFGDGVLAVARSAGGRGGRVLVLAPEIGMVEGLVSRLRDGLPRGTRVAAYHGGLGAERGAVYEAARSGQLDVLVGTRSAALFPVPDLTSVCVVDEPNGAHRAEPGYEGLPIHTREVALSRGEAEGAAVVFLSPTPSLRLYADVLRGRVREFQIPARGDWPAFRVVDMRGSGARLSDALLAACREHAADGGRIAVVAGSSGRAGFLSCDRCGAVRCCPDCGVPLAPVGGQGTRGGPLACPRCGRREEAGGRCERCGSGRLVATGLSTEKVREALAESLGAPVGLLGSGRVVADTAVADAAVAVGTAHDVLEGDWDAVLVADADALLFGGGIGAVERAFRMLYGVTEAARGLVLVQTRHPDHRVLEHVARGDYHAFAQEELPRLKGLGYPPFGHLAMLTFEGSEGAVWRAVESRLRPAFGAHVRASEPVPHPREPGRAGAPVWRVLLRSGDRAEVARAASLAARLVAKERGLRVRVEVDPEEV